MIIQLIIIFILFIVIFFLVTKNKSNNYSSRAKKHFIVIASFLMILQSGFRHYGVGPDTVTYLKMFENTESTSWSDITNVFSYFFETGEGRDIGYELFVKIFQIVSTNYRFFLIFLAIFFYSSFGYFLFKNTKSLSDIFFSIILYQALFVQYLPNSSYRQSIVIAIYLLCFELIKSRKWLLFVTIIIISSFIHRSALILIPFYFIAYNHNIRISYFINLIIFPFLMVWKTQLASFVLSLARDEYYIGYANIYESASSPIVFTIIISFVYLFVFINIRRLLKYDPGSILFLNALSLAFFFTTLIWVNPTLMRIVTYFSILLTVLLPKIYRTYNNYNRNLLYMISILLLIVLIIFGNYQYKFFWQNMTLLFDF